MITKAGRSRPLHHRISGGAGLRRRCLNGVRLGVGEDARRPPHLPFVSGEHLDGPHLDHRFRELFQELLGLSQLPGNASRLRIGHEGCVGLEEAPVLEQGVVVAGVEIVGSNGV